MAAFSSIGAGISAAVGVLGAVGAAKAGSKASKADKKAAQARAKIAKLENAKSRRNVVREQRILRGQALARGATSGGSIQSSGTQGELSSLASQERFNIGFLDESSALNTIASNQEIRASGARGDQALFAGLSNAAFNVGGLFA